MAPTGDLAADVASQDASAAKPVSQLLVHAVSSKASQKRTESTLLEPWRPEAEQCHDPRAMEGGSVAYGLLRGCS